MPISISQSWIPSSGHNVVRSARNASLSAMMFATSPNRIRASLRLAISTATLLIPFAIGCASPGPPLPPSLHLPQLVKNLTAERIGDTVELHWTTPSRTTDDLDIKGALTAEICREVRPAPSWQPAIPPSNCISVKRIPVHPGPTQTTDPLPPPLTRDPAALLVYQVQILNANGHSAGLSPEAFAAAGAAPPSVDQLRATSIRSGAQLEWKPQTAVPVDLDRILVTPPAQPKSTSKSVTVTKPKANPSLDLAPPTPTDVHLQASNQASDAGGTIDRTTQKGETYRYTAQRVRKVVLAGHTLELRSLPSPTITAVMRDTFPPASPTGLAAIPGGTGPADRSVDLSWEPVSDPDVAGYIVYRQEVSPNGARPGQFKRLTTSPVTGPAFSDQTAVPGQRYAYRVTAIDAAGNESAPSADVQETLREP